MAWLSIKISHLLLRPHLYYIEKWFRTNNIFKWSETFVWETRMRAKSTLCNLEKHATSGTRHNTISKKQKAKSTTQKARNINNTDPPKPMCSQRERSYYFLWDNLRLTRVIKSCKSYVYERKKTQNLHKCGKIHFCRLKMVFHKDQLVRNDVEYL